MSKFTDFIVGKKLNERLDKMARMPMSISARTVTKQVKNSRELKQEIRNQIMFWISIVGGVVQCANFLYTYFFVG